MRTLSSLAASAAVAFALCASSAAFAHAKLVASTPAANSTVSNVRTISLSLSESVLDKLSGVEIVMTGMPGMANHEPMKISGTKTVLGGGGKTMTVTLARPLAPGTYNVNWHGVSADTHRGHGSYSFSVK